MATEKRERQKANRRASVEQKRRTEQRDNLTQRLLAGGLILLLVVAGAFLLSRAFGGDTEAADNTFEPELATTTTVAEDVVDTVLLSAPEGGAIFEEGEETPCPADDGSSERTTAFGAPPPMCIDESAAYTAVVETDRGSFTIELDPAKAPLTVNNFVVLARYHYYEGVSFHRIIPDFVIQGGDAIGVPLGTGGPGYAFADELPEEGEYEVGSVAMANSGPDTNGSQFFVVTGEQGEALPPRWSLFGTVTDGLDVVLDIESTGTESGAPTEATTIISVTITEG